jgi:pilus assembly protein CpaC
MSDLPAHQGMVKMLHALVRRLVLATLAGAAVVAFDAGTALLRAAEPVTEYDGQATHKTVKIGLNKSLVIDLPRDARDVLVSNPVIADAVVRTPRRIYLTGVAIGQANVIIFDRAGEQIVTLDLEVERDNSTLLRMLQRLIPDSDITVEIVSDNIILSGMVQNEADSKRAQDIASIFANGGANAQPAGSGASAGGAGGAASIQISTAQPPTSSVVNLLTIAGEEQVHLKVTVAEINRNAVKQLGIDWSATNFNLGGLVFGGADLSSSASRLISNGYAVNGQQGGGFNVFGIDNITVPKPGDEAGKQINAQRLLGAAIQALERTGLFRTLAEPTLTAISGESASFLAGGEFPVPVGRDAQGNITIQFKQFGVGLSFTPIVLSEGRISLHVKTEVSELSQEGSLQLAGTSIPSLKVRRAETTMELPSGGSMVMGGLLQDDVRQSIAGLPGLKRLPVLGTLFRSRDYQRNETELVIFVTPFLVKPVPRSALARPDDGFNTPSDSAATLLSRLNRVYGAKGKPAPDGAYKGKYGFIFE